MVMGYSAMGTRMIENCVPVVEDITIVEISNGVFDDLYGVETYEEVQEPIIPSDVWTSNTRFHARFNGNLYAGNVSFGVDNTTNVLVKRRNVGEFNWITVFDQPATCAADYEFLVQDPYAPRGKLEYAIVPIINGLESEYIIAQINYDFDGLMILEDDSYIWTFTDIMISEQKNAKNIIVEPIQGRFPYYFRNGEKNYNTGTVSATFIDALKYFEECNIDYRSFDDNLALHRHYAHVMEFLNDGKAKVLKYDDGRIRIIAVTTPPSDTCDGHHDKHTIEFSYTEIGDPLSNEDMNEFGFYKISEDWW